jgi:hypothetical protein
LQTATNNRAIVLDPVCTQPFGHNVVGLKYFSEKVASFFGETTPIACSALPAKLAEQYGFKRDFSYYYQKVMPLAQLRGEKDERTTAAIERAATEDAARILRQHQLTAQDAIVFPCVDYFGLAGMLNALESMPAANLPRLLVRFIGVLEGATCSAADGMGLLRQKMKRAEERGQRFKLSAETPRYADWLALYFRMPVDLVPYPIHSDVDPQPDPMKGFSVFCPGSSRLDKGYLMLRDIFGAVRRLDPTLFIRFRLQGLPVKQAVEYSKYSNQLSAIPGVELLPTSISEEAMNEYYKAANLILLPYDPITYKMRGSAVLMECISRGKPVVGLAGSGFCDQIQYYNAGTMVADAAGLAREIVRLFQASPEKLAEQGAQARYRFLADSEHAFARWLAS